MKWNGGKRYIDQIGRKERRMRGRMRSSGVGKYMDGNRVRWNFDEEADREDRLYERGNDKGRWGRGEADIESEWKRYREKIRNEERGIRVEWRGGLWSVVELE